MGFSNLLLVSFYRFQLKSGWFKYSLPITQPLKGEFFRGNLNSKKNMDCPKDARLLLKSKLRYFSNQLVDIDSPPNWFINLDSGSIFPNDRHWSKIDDFSRGDIKLVWEASRFHWLVLASQGFASTNDREFVSLINSWLVDWSKNNPSNKGVNWKCGQEASIRVMNLLLSSFILGEVDRPQQALIQMIRDHCRRISKTLHYAIAQDNNHGTSEVSALYIGGAWLSHVGEASKESDEWLKRGRKGLEERTNHLVMDDGTFSQYSTNYHRLFLDSISLVEFFRVLFNQAEFSKKYKTKINLAIDWLFQLTDARTGNIPNLGANDGSLLLQLAGNSYQDFRPSIQFSSFLFKDYCPYHKGCNDILDWLKIDLSTAVYKEKSLQSKTFKHGGYVSIIGEKTTGLFCYPKFKFRPSQANLLHLDIMDSGRTIIGDGGTYSYNKGDEWLEYFSGISSHNTIQFNDSEPMPKLSRFLFSEWPSGRLISFTSKKLRMSTSAKYSDYLGRSHERKVSIENRTWTITDNISCFSGFAVLRWRLCKANWKIEANQLISDKAIINIKVNKASTDSINLVKGYQSDFYNELSKIDVFEIILNKPCMIETTIKLKVAVT